MDSRDYEGEPKREEDFQRKTDSDEREHVMGVGNIVRAPFRAVGWLVRAAIYLVMLMLFLAIFASVLQYVTTGRAFILEFLRGF
jgi:hypothetical protein